MTVGELVQKCREAARKESLSLAEVGRRVGVDKTQIGHWFRGRYKPSGANLLALLDAVGLCLRVESVVKEPEVRMKGVMETALERPTKDKGEGAEERPPLTGGFLAFDCLRR